MNLKKIDKWYLDIYTHFKKSKFCILEFTSYESANRMLSEIMLSTNFIMIESLLFKVDDFKYARIRKGK